MLSHALHLEHAGDHQRAGIHLRVALRRLQETPEALDSALSGLDLQHLSTPFLVALLDGTRPLRDQLPSRSALLEAVRRRIETEVDDPAARARLLSGLG
ncbi:MAG TPA: hypothetical protein ENK18_05045 [Deltaproteobacteria bacterium]|nr:hypothetical protein [Deltaproteobacteria bacterium]